MHTLFSQIYFPFYIYKVLILLVYHQFRYPDSRFYNTSIYDTSHDR